MKLSKVIEALEEMKSSEDDDPEIIIVWWSQEVFEYQHTDGEFYLPSDGAIAYADEMVNNNGSLMAQMSDAIVSYIEHFNKSKGK